jgi:hypothetical protein
MIHIRSAFMPGTNLRGQLAKLLMRLAEGNPYSGEAKRQDIFSLDFLSRKSKRAGVVDLLRRAHT